MRTIIFKAIEKCNANCVYCYVKPNKTVMGLDLLKIIFNKINEFLVICPQESIEFLWHGGEVCLLGPEYFKRVYEIQQIFCEKTYERIHHAVQSNLTLINQEIIDVLKLFGITSVGTSYDMIPNIRGFGPSRNSIKYNSCFFKGIELLRLNKIHFGMIYVVHKKTLQCTPEDIFYHLINIAYDGSIKFNPVLIDGYDKHNLTISEEEYAHFKGKIFLEWWKNRFIAPQIGNFRDYYLQIVNKPYSGVCTNTGRCAFRWLYISPNGDVTHCCESDLRNNSYGNIRDRSLEDLYFHEERNKILSRHYILPKNDCSECILWGICHGGCSWAAKNSRNSFNSTFRCSSKKIFFFEYFIPTTGLKIDLKPQIF